jgi:CheY-like chemotaxis protein
LHGSVGAKSKLGAGSSFWIDIPYIRLRELAREISQSPSPARPIRFNNEQLSVLYIENNQSNVALMKGYFNDVAHVRLLCAENAEIGIVFASEYQPELIFIDLNLPDIDGYTALHKLKAEAKLNDTAVVAVTTDVMKKTREKVKQAGFDDFLAKPISFNTLQKMLQQYLTTTTR